LRAVLLRETGGPEALRVEEVDEPEGLVATVRAAGVNFADVLMRAGNYPQPTVLPAVLGGEVAGELDDRRVLALTGGGGYAERVVLDPAWTFTLPDGVSFEEGASFLTTYLTAYIPLTLQAPISAASTVLVHAGSGGVGSAAIQLAKHFGARVVATASTDEKRTFAGEQGADETYSYDDFAAHVRADVVLDPVGGELVAVSHKVLEPLGVHVLIGFAGGRWQPVDPALLVGRNVSLAGFYLGRLMRFAPELVREAANELLDLWRAGAIRPVVGSTFTLDNAADAHRLIEQRRHVGKVVLVP
jgi:NADPH2:quinone reductase